MIRAIGNVLRKEWDWLVAIGVVCFGLERFGQNVHPVMQLLIIWIALSIYDRYRYRPSLTKN